MKALTAILFILIVGLAAPAAAQSVDQRELVEVSGIGEIKVVPDEFVVRTSIDVFGKSLEEASSQNDAAIARLFKSVSKLGVERKYIVTDTISVNAVTDGYRERGNFRRLGYSVSREVTIVLHDPKRIEPVMKELFTQGVDRLTMSMGRTDMQDLLENAQIKAASAARQKAKILSSALGRTLGQAVSIEEATPGRNDAQNFVYTADTPDLGDTISLGKIRVQASVRVKFTLG